MVERFEMSLISEEKTRELANHKYQLEIYIQLFREILFVGKFVYFRNHFHFFANI